MTVEAGHNGHAARIAEVLDALEGVRVLWREDRALLRHEGGKLTIDAFHPIHAVHEMRDVCTPGVAGVCRAIADFATDDAIVPDALDQEVHDAVARPVRDAADQSGVSRPEGYGRDLSASLVRWV